jgi:hypothetical protein
MSMSHFEAIRRLAFSIPAPNPVTPQIVQAANSAEAERDAFRARVAELEAILLTVQRCGALSPNLHEQISNLIER